MRLMSVRQEGEKVGKLDAAFDESTFGVSELATSFARVGYRHWDEVLSSRLGMLRIYDRSHSRPALLSGPAFEEFLRFKSALGNHRRRAQDIEDHTVQIVESTDFQRVFVIDGFAISFIDSNSSLTIENLLLGIRALIDNPESESSSNLREEDLKEDIDFLNYYFNLGLELRRVGEIRVELDLPSNVRVNAPVAVDLEGQKQHLKKSRPRWGAA